MFHLTFKNMVLRVDPFPNALLYNSYSIGCLLVEGRVCMCRVYSDKTPYQYALLSHAKKRWTIEEAIFGVKVVKKKLDVALLINGKLKHKVFTNKHEECQSLLAWLHKQNVDHIHACQETSCTYGDELALALS